MPSAKHANRAKRVDVGLNIKFQKKSLQRDGYSRRNGESDWEYSQDAVKLVRDYKEAWPQIFDAVGRLRGSDRLQLSDIFGDDVCPPDFHQVDAFAAWLPGIFFTDSSRRFHKYLLSRLMRLA